MAAKIIDARNHVLNTVGDKEKTVVVLPGRVTATLVGSGDGFSLSGLELRKTKMKLGERVELADGHAAVAIKQVEANAIKTRKRLAASFQLR